MTALLLQLHTRAIDPIVQIDIGDGLGVLRHSYDSVIMIHGSSNTKLLFRSLERWLPTSLAITTWSRETHV